MKNKKSIISIVTYIFGLLLVPTITQAQQKPAYKIFTAEGKETSYDKMLKKISEADVIFFGELHNNSMAHWLELQALSDLYRAYQNVTLAMEMFEADDQIVIDEYLNGTIEEKHLLKEAKIWDNYKTDYRPLVEFAKEKKLKVIASNIPRRYASLAYKKGLSALDSLSPESKKWIAPLPVDVDLQLKGYKELMAGMGGHGGAASGENLAKSQAIKDATMAYFIERSKTDSNKIFHVNGSYHSQDGEGIIGYLKKLNPKITIGTIHVVEQVDVEKLDEASLNKADFILCIPSNMTKTY
jgi:uncharacterized iron-regulated protein